MRRDKTLTGDPVFTCDACQATWTVAAKQWLVKDKSGRLSYRPLATDADGNALPLILCPVCSKRNEETRTNG